MRHATYPYSKQTYTKKTAELIWSRRHWTFVTPAETEHAQQDQPVYNGFGPRAAFGQTWERGAMTDTSTAAEPDWDSPLSLNLTPARLIHALFGTASVVHTGWSSCVEEPLVVSDLAAMDNSTGNYCRLVEQEFVEDGAQETVWHDWAVEIRLGDVLITGHWQLETSAPPLDWDWASGEAERVFEKACVLFGKRVRRGILIENPPATEPPAKTKHH